MASNQQHQQKAPAQDEKPAAVVADDSTKTVYGVTLGELIAQQVRDRETLTSDVTAKAARIKELEAKLAEAEGDKGTMRNLILDLRPYRTITRMKDGGVRLPIELDADTAIRYLAQAEDAKEDPQEYIQRQLSEALLAYSNA